MALYGQGIIPAQIPYGQELAATTRRGFMPYYVVQIYQSSPVLAALLSNKQTAGGGVSSISVPVQGAPLTTSQWTGYSGAFTTPTQQAGSFLGEFNLKALITPVTFLGMEGALQLDHAVVPLLEARMNDAGNNGAAALQTALYGNSTNTTQMIGFPGAIDDGTNASTYGNLSRSYSWWQSKQYAAGTVAPTRKLVLQYIVGCQKYGSENPTMAVMGPGTWTNLADDFVGQESYQIQPGRGFDSDGDRPRSAFKALDVAGVPVYMDLGCPEGTMYLLNTKYMHLHVHEQANFSFSGFESLLSNSVLGYIGIVLTLCELVVVKPTTQSAVSGFTSISL
jgi:hypothetical protein